MYSNQGNLSLHGAQKLGDVDRAQSNALHNKSVIDVMLSSTCMTHMTVHCLQITLSRSQRNHIHILVLPERLFGAGVTALKSLNVCLARPLTYARGLIPGQPAGYWGENHLLVCACHHHTLQYPVFHLHCKLEHTCKVGSSSSRGCIRSCAISFGACWKMDFAPAHIWRRFDDTTSVGASNATPHF
eukprot:1160758-Pelagomonas_calceolata.AAC.6